jgi:hypothetical protein
MAPRVATVHNTIKETIRAHLTLVHIFHVYASTDTLWMAHALSHYTPIRYGRITSVSAAHKDTSLRDPIKSCMRQYTTQTCSPGPDDQSLTDTSGGYHLGALNFRSDHSPSILSSILHFPLIATPDLQLCQPLDHLAKPHRTSINKKGPITSRFQPLIFYQ